MDGDIEGSMKDPNSRQFVEDFTVSEEDNLDFKALPLGDDLNCVVRRLIKDIAAMANSGGGHLVIGRDQKGKALPGAPKSLVKDDDTNIMQAVGKYLSPAPDVSKALVTTTDPSSKGQVTCVTLRIECYKDFPCVVSSVVDVPDHADPRKNKTEARPGDIFVRKNKSSMRVDSEEEVRKVFHPALIHEARKLVTDVVGVVGATPPEKTLDTWYEESRLLIKSQPSFRKYPCYFYFWCSPQTSEREFELRELDRAVEKVSPNLLGGYAHRKRISQSIQWGFDSLSYLGLSRLDRQARFFTCCSILHDDAEGLYLGQIVGDMARWVAFVSALASGLQLEQEWIMHIELADCRGIHLCLPSRLHLPPEYVCNDSTLKDHRPTKLPSNGNELRDICEKGISNLIQSFGYDRFTLNPGSIWAGTWAEAINVVGAQHAFYQMENDGSR